MSKLKISGIIEESIVDGWGIRFTIFSQGCEFNCPNCHNPQTHDINGGYDMDIKDIFNKIISTPIISGVTFSGGEPFLQAKAFSELAETIHNQTKLDIITYTGYTFEQLTEISKHNVNFQNLMLQSDFIIDGRFENDKKTFDLKFRGSSNQRIILVKESLKLGKIIERLD